MFARWAAAWNVSDDDPLVEGKLRLRFRPGAAVSHFDFVGISVRVEGMHLACVGTMACRLLCPNSLIPRVIL